jgi:hypothetical protein
VKIENFVQKDVEVMRQELRLFKHEDTKGKYLLLTYTIILHQFFQKQEDFTQKLLSQ